MPPLTATIWASRPTNGAIAVDNDETDTQTVLERAKALGKSTELVVTSQVNHATPAAYAAYERSRSNYNEIAAPARMPRRLARPLPEAAGPALQNPERPAALLSPAPGSALRQVTRLAFCIWLSAALTQSA
ncbi:alkaline phosphatase [Paenibacillus sabuli]|uniref:alkaline phosphatase n=1 Tax=Paenibacillus sabuli TaxID=2772509 RepID=UPI00295AA0DE|nr:alkaline phosphatase [Paenibacillus sabuli]